MRPVLPLITEKSQQDKIIVYYDGTYPKCIRNIGVIKISRVNLLNRGVPI